MTAISSESGPVCSRYAAALLDMAEGANAIEAVARDLRDLASMIGASEDLRKLIGNPLFGRVQQERAILAVAEKAGFHKLTVNFLGTLAQNRRLPLLNGVIAAVDADLKKRRGEVSAHVQAAFALSPEQTRALQEQLGKAMGSHVTLDVEINKDLLGGLIVTVGSKQIDDSVRHKLDRLKRAMSQGKAA